MPRQEPIMEEFQHTLFQLSEVGFLSFAGFFSGHAKCFSTCCAFDGLWGNTETSEVE